MMVTIVIPVYNAEDTVRDTLDSVLMQTFSDFEVILADDASSDESLEIIKSYAEKDSRIRIIRNETNRGAAVSRNEAVRNAKGDLIAFLDSDDLWASDKLEKQIRSVENNPDALIWFTGSGFISADGTPKANVLHVPEKVDRGQLLKQNVISCSSVMLRRDTAVKHPFPDDPKCHEDYAVWLSVLENGGYACGLDQPLLIYRLGAGKSANKLKAAFMNWRTYGAAGLTFLQKCRYMASYAIRSVRKYTGIMIEGNK